MSNWKVIKGVCAILLLPFLISEGNATEPFTPVFAHPLAEAWRWRQFPELEGKGVRCMVEDADGNIWFGLNEGLSKYDGRSWQWQDASTGLTDAPIEQICAGKEDRVYAASAEGILFLFEKDRQRRLFASDPQFPFIFLRLKELSDGSLLACSDRGLLHIREGAPVRLFTTSEQQPELKRHYPGLDYVRLPEALYPQRELTGISDVLEDRGGQIWLAVTLDEEGAIFKFRMADVEAGAIRQYEVFTSNQRVKFGESQKMILTDDHKIWVINSSFKVGISIYDPGEGWRYLELSDLFGGDEFTTDIIQYSDGAIWIGALGKIFVYHRGNWNLYKAPAYKIPANRLMLYEGSNDKLWIVGVKSKPLLFDYSTERWLTYQNLNFQCENEQGDHWFLDIKGRAIVRRGEQWTAYGTADGLMDAPVRIIKTRAGQIWAAGSHRGVAATAYLRDGRWHKQEHPALSWGIDYRAVFEARDGSLWFGGGVDFDREKGQAGGVLQLPDPTAADLNWIHHRYQQNGLNQSNAYGIGQSADGRIWIGGGSLFYYDGRQWARPEEELLHQFVNIVFSTEDGLLVVGSRNYGIFLYDGREWRHHDTDSGLTNNTIISLYATSAENIWAATESDISRFDGRTWTNYVFPPAMTMEHEGGSLQLSSNGAIWINKSPREWKRRALNDRSAAVVGGEQFLSFHYQPDRQPPRTVIELYTKDVSPKGNVLINWKGEDYFEATASDRLQFSYRLDGAEWSEFSPETNYNFFNLPSGDHTFEVRARDLDFNVDPIPARVSFTVRAPVWRQTWFILLLLVFLLTIGIFEFRIISKKQKLERLNAEIRSQRDQLEEMVIQVESLSKSKINFFTNISHELRTPLTLIQGPVDQLQSGQALSAGDRRLLYDIIQRNSHRLLKLINQLLELRLIENAALRLNPDKENIGKFLAEIVSLFDYLAAEKKVRLSFQNNCQDATPVIDPDKIEKIITNLLSNAFKHTPPGGRITVVLDPVTGEEPGFRITVEDTGAGISRQEISHIFKRYYTSGPDQAGAGIGLSYIKELVELHQGTIEVESEIGKGTRFRVYLPALSATAPNTSKHVPSSHFLQLTRWEVESQLPSPAGSLPAASRKPPTDDMPRILIVDDNPDMVRFLASILQREYQVRTAYNGREALEIARNCELELIISDVMMPEMDGLEFCRCIKSDLATSHIPVILLTAKSMEEHQMRGYTTGADHYITKPFSPDMLLVRVRNILAQRKQLHEKFMRDFMLQPDEVRLTSPDEELLARLVEIMEEHISDSDFNVNKMCDMVNLSHMHFIRKMKQLTGKKPIELLRSFRMKRAKELLKQNKANISEVAYMVGYDLPNSFSRAFKKEFGLSPTEYVESLGHRSTNSAI